VGIERVIKYRCDRCGTFKELKNYAPQPDGWSAIYRVVPPAAAITEFNITSVLCAHCDVRLFEFLNMEDAL